jgi:cytidylate kinase
VKPAGAIVIDTSGLTLEEVVARILAAVGSP